MSDPFQEAHRAVQRKVGQDEEKQRIVQRDARVAAAEVKRKQPKRVDPPYPWPNKIWEP